MTLAVGRAAAAMGRYVGDIADARSGVQTGLWRDAIGRARTVTTLITGALRQETSAAPMFPPGSAVARLDGYATALTYGRDLLHTHLAVTPNGARQALSDWAPVISSPAVNRALLAGLADHARAIAEQLAGLRLARSADTETAAAWHRLQGAAVQLRQLGAAVQAAQWQAPVLPEHRRLLEAIPVNVTPAVQALPPEASISDLCAGIISTTQRANQSRRELAAQAAWSPELTAESMRHAAANYVVISFNSETVYRALAVRARQLGYHALVPGLDAAADHADDSRRAWLAVAHVWDTMATDSRAFLSRPAVEAGRLALWTGRLAYADPAWTPARRPSHAVRDPASLAPDPAALTEIAGAMHYVTDSLARAARTEHDTVRTAAAARRLYVTTRSLPETYDVRRPYANAPRYRVADALAAYADTAEVSQVALHSAAYAAAAVDAPSWVLSAADQATAGLVVAPRGRLEQHLLDLGVRDAELLRKGVDLDEMAQQVVAQAHRAGLSLPPSAVEAGPELVAADEPAEVARPAGPELDTAEEVAADEPAEVARPAGPELDTAEEVAADEPAEVARPAGPELDTAEEVAADEPAEVARPAGPELDTAEEVAADEPAEVARPAEAAADEPEIDGGLEIGLD